jgi:hypothetical protein
LLSLAAKLASLSLNCGARCLRVSERGGGRMATEYLQFAGALVFFLAILTGSYWFVYVPQSRGSDEDRHLREE